MSNDEYNESISPEILPENFFESVESQVSGMMSQAVMKSFRGLAYESKFDNIAIYIDYDNVYWTLMNIFNHDPDHTDPEKNLFEQLWKRYPRDSVRTFRAYADFDKINADLTSLQKKRVQIRHVYSNDRSGDSRKNASDIEMCIDAIESTYKDPSIGCYVFVTADSDIVPILSRMMFKGKRVELLYLSTAAPKSIDITSYAHDSADLIDFLRIDERSYDIPTYAPRALQLINEWHAVYRADRSKWLGAGWLKDHLQSMLGLPGDQVSKLIEYLELQGLMELENRGTNRGEKRSYRLTLKGSSMVSTAVSEAATGEH